MFRSRMYTDYFDEELGMLPDRSVMTWCRIVNHFTSQRCEEAEPVSLDQALRVLIMKPSKRTNAMAGERSQPVRRQRAKTQVAAAAAAKTQAAATAAAAAAAKTQSAATAGTAAVATPNPKADACFVAAVGPMVLSIGSDCSGWCTELHAARAVCPIPSEASSCLWQCISCSAADPALHQACLPLR